MPTNESNIVPIPIQDSSAQTVRVGDSLAALGRKIGLTNEDVELVEKGRDKTPAKPLKFD